MADVRKNNRLAVIYALIAVAMWSTVATAFKLSLAQLTPLQLLCGASIISLIVLSIALVWQKQWGEAITTLPQNIRSAVSMALLNPVIYYLVLLQAYDLLPAQVAQSINYTWAITLTLLSVPLLGHRLTRRDLIAIVLGYFGVVLISISGKNITGEISYYGLFLALASTLIWAAYWLLNARDHRPPIVKLFQSFLIASPFLLLLMLMTEGLPAQITVKQLLAVSYIGVFEMGLAFICWQLALHYTTRVSKVSTLIFLSPFVSLFIINYFLGEPLQVLTFAGLGLIVVGILIQQAQNEV